MTHFPVLVALARAAIDKAGGAVEGALAAALQRYDERLDVELHRAPEDDDPTPAEHWWIRALRRDLEVWRELAEHGREAVARRLAAEKLERITGDPFARLTDTRDVETSIAEHVAKEIADAEHAGQHAEVLDGEITWELVARLYNERWHPLAEGAPEPVPGVVPDDEVDLERIHVGEDGRPYTWSRSNPDGRWDWFVIGGRWQRCLLAVPDADTADLAFGGSGSGGDNGQPRRHPVTDGRWCDGMQVRHLDRVTMADDAARSALINFDRYRELAAQHPAARPWRHYADRAKAREFDWREAGERYRAQPLMAAVREAGLDDGWGDCPIESYGRLDRDAFERLARAQSVPASVLVTTDGEWIEPGRHGWFGSNSATPVDRDAFLASLDAYLDGLPGDTVLLLVDCHV